MLVWVGLELWMIPSNPGTESINAYRAYIAEAKSQAKKSQSTLKCLLPEAEGAAEEYGLGSLIG